MAKSYGFSVFQYILFFAIQLWSWYEQRLKELQLYSCTQLALKMFNDPMAILNLSSTTQENITGAGQSKPRKIEAAKLYK